MGRPRGVIWQEFAETDNDADTGKERVKCRHCERVVSKRAHRLQQHLVGCKAYARAVELKLTTDEALQSFAGRHAGIGASSGLMGVGVGAHHHHHDHHMMAMPLEPPPGLHIGMGFGGGAGGGSEGSAGRRRLEPTTAGRQLEADQVYEFIKEFYGARAQRGGDAILSGRNEGAAQHAIIEQILTKVPEEVLRRSIGVGMPVPLGIDGLRVLDLGCGSGRDAYVAAALVGARGFVLGIDVTPQQVEIAERGLEEFNASLGYRQANLRFLEGHMEFLDKSGIAGRSIDLVISNAVLNLSPNKELALKEVLRVLRPGGELQFSDVFASRRLPESVRKHDVLYSECIGGALYIEDFKRICRQIGFGEPREVARTPLEIKNSGYSAMVGLAKFYSITFRCFKVPHIESGAREEDYGHVATYLGTIPGLPHGYELDSTHFFESLRPLRVGGNTAAILKHSWLKKYFNVHGDWSVHFGEFEGNPTLAAVSARPSAAPVDRVAPRSTPLMPHENSQTVELNGADSTIF